MSVIRSFNAIPGTAAGGEGSPKDKMPCAKPGIYGTGKKKRGSASPAERFRHGDADVSQPFQRVTAGTMGNQKWK